MHDVDRADGTIKASVLPPCYQLGLEFESRARRKWAFRVNPTAGVGLGVEFQLASYTSV